MNIKLKLILLFVVLKVVPLVFIAFTAIEAAKQLGISFKNDSSIVLQESTQIIKATADTAIKDSISALDKKSQESIEMLTLQIAHEIAHFLKQRDSDLLFLASFQPNVELYERFIKTKQSEITVHEPYVYDDVTNEWKSSTKRPFTDKIMEKAVLKDNEREFNKRSPSPIEKVSKPIYKEITFYDLEGHEMIKSSSIESQKRFIAQKDNTYIKAERYFKEAQKLKKGEIYVSDVIGAYVDSKVIGAFTKPKAEKANTPFTPELSGYAGVENPVGKHFEGIVRFVTPVFMGEKKIGYVTLALDHAHLSEFTDFIYPTEKFLSNIKDAQEGNYAFIWDYKGRSIAHPRDYSIVGYDPSTGEQIPGWISADLKEKWDQSGIKDLNAFLETVTPFDDQGWHKKPNVEQIKKGHLGLDCRYLNFAPQCQGWFQLVKDGGYGSFMILWSGVQKLTTAAAIPYYTGQYGASKVGFGFVTIGANSDEFHSAANNTQANIDTLLKAKSDDMGNMIEMSKNNTLKGVSVMIKEITIATVVLTLIVVLIAVFVADSITKKIFILIAGAKAFSDNKLDYVIKIDTKDEFGKLAKAFNTMARAIAKLIDEQKELNNTLEERVKEELAKNRAKDHKLIAQSRLAATGEMLGNIAHHWRQPLSTILVVAQDMKEAHKFGELNANYLEGSIAQITQSTSYMSNVIDQFGHFFESTEEVVDFNAGILIDEILGLMARTFEHEGIVISQSIAKDVCISGYPHEFRQVVVIVLTNAQEAILRHKGEQKIFVTLDGDGDKMHLSIQDSGGGIDPKIAHKIFDPYFSTKFESQGTGLGLYMAKMMVENTMNGTIAATNTQDGCMIDIIIPQVETCQ